MDEATRKYDRRYYLADRARFLADGLPCQMEELPKRSVRKWIKPSVYGGER
jgi:hypothetical protein